MRECRLAVRVGMWLCALPNTVAGVQAARPPATANWRPRTTATPQPSGDGAGRAPGGAYLPAAIFSLPHIPTGMPAAGEETPHSL
jgi:hypothetical protein